MPKNLTLVIAAVLFAGAGFGLGLLAHRSSFAQPGAGDTKSEPPRKDFDELLTAWKYPGAKLTQSAAGGKLYYSVLTTGDDINEVAKHYGKLLGGRVSVEGSGGMVAGGEETAVALASDSLTADNKPRSVQVALASQRTKDYVVTLHISRSKDEDTTHIVLSFAQR